MNFNPSYELEDVVSPLPRFIDIFLDYFSPSPAYDDLTPFQMEVSASGIDLPWPSPTMSELANEYLSEHHADSNGFDVDSYEDDVDSIFLRSDGDLQQQQEFRSPSTSPFAQAHAPCNANCNDNHNAVGHASNECEGHSPFPEEEHSSDSSSDSIYGSFLIKECLEVTRAIDSAPPLKSAFSPAAGANHRLTGVNFHKRSGKYDANVWITDQKRQEYLGSFEQPEVAAVARDVFILHLYFRDDQKVKCSDPRRRASQRGSMRRSMNQEMSRYPPEIVRYAVRAQTRALLYDLRHKKGPWLALIKDFVPKHGYRPPSRPTSQSTTKHIDYADEHQCARILHQ